MSFYSSIAEYYDDIFIYDTSSADFILREIQDLSNGGTVIDIGCGTGSLAVDLASRGCRVTAIDFDEGMIAASIKKSNSGNPVFRQMDMRTVQDHFPPESFDAVVCTGNTLANLQTVPDLMDAIRGFSAVLRDGGTAVIQILNYDHIIDAKISDLPVVKTDSFVFERHYEFEKSGTVLFRAAFTGTGSETFSNEIHIYPLKKYELTAMLLRANFAEVNFFGSMNGDELTDDSLPLVCVAQKRSDCH